MPDSASKPKAATSACAETRTGFGAAARPITLGGVRSMSTPVCVVARNVLPTRSAQGADGRWSVPSVVSFTLSVGCTAPDPESAHVQSASTGSLFHPAALGGGLRCATETTGFLRSILNGPTCGASAQFTSASQTSRPPYVQDGPSKPSASCVVMAKLASEACARPAPPSVTAHVIVTFCACHASSGCGQETTGGLRSNFRPLTRASAQFPTRSQTLLTTSVVDSSPGTAAAESPKLAAEARPDPVSVAVQGTVSSVRCQAPSEAAHETAGSDSSILMSPIGPASAQFPTASQRIRAAVDAFASNDPRGTEVASAKLVSAAAIPAPASVALHGTSRLRCQPDPTGSHATAGRARSIAIGRIGPAVAQLPATSHTARLSVPAFASATPSGTEVERPKLASAGRSSPEPGSAAAHAIVTFSRCQPPSGASHVISGGVVSPPGGAAATPRSRRKRSRRPFVSPATRFVAVDETRTKRPSALRICPLVMLESFAGSPAPETLARSVVAVVRSRIQRSKAPNGDGGPRLAAFDANAT